MNALALTKKSNIYITLALKNDHLPQKLTFFKL